MDREVRRALDSQLGDSLRPLSVGLAALFGVLAMLKPAVMGFTLQTGILSAWQIALAVGFVGLRSRLRRPLPPNWAHPVATLIVLLVLVDAMLHTAIRANPLETISFALILIAAAFFYNDRRWFFPVAALVVAASYAIVVGFLPPASWADVGIALVEASVIAGVVFVFRSQSLARLVVSERALQHTASVLAAQNEASTAGVLVVDAAGRIVTFNRRFVEMWGIPHDVIESRSDELALASAIEKLVDPKAFLDRVDHLYAHPEESGWDTIPLVDGRTFERYTAPVTHQDGALQGRVWFFHDVTERERSEAEIRKLNAELERRIQMLIAANRELEAFGYTVSHDLRAPIRGIEHHAQELAEEHGGALGSPGLELVDRIRRQARRAEQIIVDMLSLARGSRGDFRRERVDLTQMATSIVEELRAAEPARIVVFDAAPALEAMADPGLIKVALANLLGNAWKYTRTRGEARISFGRKDGAFFVRDDGVGFDPAKAHDLFVAFHRMHPESEYEGTGIGLATVRRIIERHGGKVWADAAPDGGATFSFTLPP